MKSQFNQTNIVKVTFCGLLSVLFVFAAVVWRAKSVAAATTQVNCPSVALPLVKDFGAAPAAGSASADFDRDGKLDLAISFFDEQRIVVRVFKGDGLNGFSEITTINLPANIGYTGYRDSSLVAADVNGDGQQDLVIVQPENDTGFYVYLNDGQGKFSSVITSQVRPGYSINSFGSFAVGDFNKDGKADIVANRDGNYGVYLGAADGRFTKQPNDFGTPGSVLVADFNKDGNQDLFIAGRSSNTFSFLWYGDGTGKFFQGEFNRFDQELYFFAAADFNKDGQVDVLGDVEGVLTGQFVIWLNNGNGTFQQTTITDNSFAGGRGGSRRVADINGDGSPDVIGQGYISLNNGQGGVCVTPAPFGQVYQMIAADLNRDGRSEVLTLSNPNVRAQLYSSTGVASNTPPSITLQPTTAAQGAASTPVFGMVADTETPASNLQLSVTGLPTGVALTNFTSVNGEVKASLTIDCGSAPGTYQIPIKVTDAGGLSATANWALTVTANQAPVLGTYANTTANASTVTIAPNRAPSDDGAIILFQVNNPVNVGAISITQDGVVTITKSTVVGSYPIIVTATDNCGLRTSTSFTFTIPSAPPTGCDLPSFSLLTTITVPGLSPIKELIPGDFNKDGFQDVIAIQTVSVTSSEAPISKIYFGDGKGGLTLNAALSNIQTLFGPNDLFRTGDFNGDGYLDLGILKSNGVLGGRVLFYDFEIFVNNKQGRLESNGVHIAGSFSDVEVGDLNNDGFSDLLLNTGYNYGVWLNNKNGSFSKLPEEFGAPPKVILADVNQDGKLDVLNDANGLVFIWLGDVTGRFRQDRLLDTGTLRLVADLNKDGRNDIVMQRADGALQIYLYREVLILGNRVFTFALTSYPEYTSAAVASADFNGDGVLDLALADGRVVVNDGFGRFCGSADFRAQGLTSPAAAADFDGDGRADILTKDATHFYLWKSGGRVIANTAPKITVGTGLSLPGGSNKYLVPLVATITDAESSINNLSVTATSTNSAIVVNEVLKSAGGGIELRLTTNFCDTALPSFTINLTATDEGGLTTIASVPIQLTANPAPLLGQYVQNVQTPVGQTIQANPGQAPFDNGLFDLQVIQPAPGGGTASVNSNGLLTIVNTTVAGSYSVRVRVVEVGCNNVTERVINYSVIGIAPPATCTTPTFAAPLHLAANNNPYGLTSGDFNGDGKVDLATTNIYDNTVTVLLAGASGYTKQAPIAVGGSPNYLVARDLNGDNKLDLVVVNRGSDTVTILLGTGNGTFTKKGDYSVGNKSTGVAIGDFNNDNKLDLILPNDGLGNAVVLDGNGDGSFAAPRYLFAGNSPQPGVVADFNKDGRADVAFPNYTTGEVVILLGTGVGTFQSAIYVGNLGGSGVEGIAVGDVNGDGNLDLAVTNTTTNQVFTILGNGQGSFVNSGGFATLSNYPASIVIADFTGDGKADIAVGGYNNGQVHVFRGLGNGFESSAPLVVTVGVQPVSLLTNDFNGDGKPDLAVANNGSGTISVLLNGCVK